MPPIPTTQEPTPWECRHPAGKRAGPPTPHPQPPGTTAYHPRAPGTTAIPPANGPQARQRPTRRHQAPPPASRPLGAPAFRRQTGRRPVNAPLTPSGTVRHFPLSLTTSHWPLVKAPAPPPANGPQARRRPTRSHQAPPPTICAPGSAAIPPANGPQGPSTHSHHRQAPPPPLASPCCKAASGPFQGSPSQRLPDSGTAHHPRPLGAPPPRRQTGRKAHQRTPTTARHHPHHSHPPAARPPQARSRVPPLNASPANDHQASPATRAPWERRRPTGKRPAGPPPPGTTTHHTPPGTTTTQPASGPQANAPPATPWHHRLPPAPPWERRRPAGKRAEGPSTHRPHRQAPPPTTRAPETTTTPPANAPQARQRPTRCRPAPPLATRAPWQPRHPTGKRPAGPPTPHPQPPAPLAASTLSGKRPAH